MTCEPPHPTPPLHPALAIPYPLHPPWRHPAGWPPSTHEWSRSWLPTQAACTPMMFSSSIICRPCTHQTSRREWRQVPSQRVSETALRCTTKPAGGQAAALPWQGEPGAGGPNCIRCWAAHFGHHGQQGRREAVAAEEYQSLAVVQLLHGFQFRNKTGRQVQPASNEPRSVGWGELGVPEFELQPATSRPLIPIPNALTHKSRCSGILQATWFPPLPSRRRPQTLLQPVAIDRVVQGGPLGDSRCEKGSCGRGARACEVAGGARLALPLLLCSARGEKL